MYLFLASVYGLALIGARYVGCSSAPSEGCAAAATWGGSLSLLAISAHATFTALFTSALAYDQTHVAFTGRTQIDRKKGGGGGGGSGEEEEEERDGAAAGARTGGADRKRRLWLNLSEVCGGDAPREGARLAWLLPTRIVYPEPERYAGYSFQDIAFPRKDRQLEELETV